MKKEEMYKILQEEKEFTDKIDIIVNEKLKAFESIRKEYRIYMYQMFIDDERLTKILEETFGGESKYISLCIRFSLLYDAKLDAVWEYKNKTIRPNGHYVRPNKSRFITINETLRECIKQDTNTPDVKELETNVVEEGE